MPSTFFGLNIAYTGLQASQASINTTGNNISNVETKGYSRQKLTQEAADALRTNTTYGMAGAGVNAISVDQIRNKYYDLKYWRNNADLGSYEVQKYYMKQIEDYFTEKDTVKGFGTIFGDVFNALEEVYKNPGDDTKKAQFLSQAGNLCEYFAAQSTNLQKLQTDVNAEIRNRMDSINTIAEQIATLNKQINTIEITGPTANELRDKRNLLIDELSKIVDVEVTEKPVYDLNGNESGIYHYFVDIAGGQSLVDGYDYNTLSCVARDYKVNQSDAEGLYDIMWSNGIEFNLYGRNLGGELKGLVEMRDGNNEEYFHGKLKEEAGTATLPWDSTKTVKTIKIDAAYDYLKDMNKCTLANTGVIQVSNKLFEYTGWDYNVDAATGKGTYTFYLKEGSDVPAGLANQDVRIGTAIDYQGIPYYQEQMNEWVRCFTQAMNKIELGAQDAMGNQAEVLFTAEHATDPDTPYKFDDYDFSNPNQKASSYGNYYTQMTAANVKVNKKMENDVSYFGTTADISKGVDAQDITEQLKTVKTDKTKMMFRGCTSQEFLQTILSDVALGASNANTFSTNFANISKAIQNQRLSVSGVDNDEEALNLVKYQEAYNLSAKMMQIMTEIYDKLINGTGV